MMGYNQMGRGREERTGKMKQRLPHPAVAGLGMAAWRPRARATSRGSQAYAQASAAGRVTVRRGRGTGHGSERFQSTLRRLKMDLTRLESMPHFASIDTSPGDCARHFSPSFFPSLHPFFAAFLLPHHGSRASVHEVQFTNHESRVVRLILRGRCYNVSLGRAAGWKHPRASPHRTISGRGRGTTA